MPAFLARQSFSKMNFEEWFSTHWKWGSSTDEAKARRAWWSARDELKERITMLEAVLSEYADLFPKPNKASVVLGNATNESDPD